MSKKQIRFTAVVTNREITLEEVINTKLIPHKEGSQDVMRLGKAKDGGVWFKNQQDGVCYRIILKDGSLVVAETRDSKKTQTERKKTTSVVCCECGAIRTIAVQDAFQVKRCVACQKKHRTKKRTEIAKRKRQEAKKQRELENLNSKKKGV